MPFKYDANGALVTADHNGIKLPVFIDAKGKEAPLDGDATIGSIARLNGEAQGHRQRAETAEAAYKPFLDAGLTDVAAAVKAIGIVKNLDEKKLVDAGEVETVKRAAVESVEAKYAPVVKERDALKGRYANAVLGSAFAGSKFITDKVAVPPDMIQAMFGRHFEVGEDGKIAAKDSAGNQIYSPTNPGGPASFDEALEVIVGGYAHKDSILKGTGHSGGGAGNNGGRAQNGKRSVLRSEFDKMSPMEKSALMVDVGKGAAQLTD